MLDRADENDDAFLTMLLEELAKPLTAPTSSDSGRHDAILDARDPAWACVFVLPIALLLAVIAALLSPLVQIKAIGHRPRKARKPKKQRAARKRKARKVRVKKARKKRGRKGRKGRNRKAKVTLPTY